MTPSEHEAIQELLAGHVLHALDEEDAQRAEELLMTHVPSCPGCMGELERLTVVAGELALAAGSRRPPHLLGLRIRRETSARRAAAWIARAAVVAAAVAIVSVLLWNLRLSGRVSHAEARQARTAEVLTTVANPAARVVPMSAEIILPGRLVSITVMSQRAALMTHIQLTRPAPLPTWL